MTATQPRRRYASVQARRGREWYVQLRVTVHRLRSLHIEPRAIWVSPATANDMRALWREVCTVEGRSTPQYDGSLPSVAGVKVREGMTGGQDYVIEHFDTAAESHKARDIMNPVFRVQDNPLDGTH